MAEVAVTVAERVNLFGGAPSNKWGAHLWGAFLYGEGNTNAAFGLGIGVAEFQDFSTSDVGVAPVLIISEQLSLIGSLGNFYLLDQNGYYHVFSDNTTDGEGRDDPTWTATSSGTASWAAQSMPTVTWS